MIIVRQKDFGDVNIRIKPVENGVSYLRLIAPFLSGLKNTSYIDENGETKLNKSKIARNIRNAAVYESILAAGDCGSRLGETDLGVLKRIGKNIGKNLLIDSASYGLGSGIEYLSNKIKEKKKKKEDKNNE